ncbi:MAG: acetolactate decarboxylase [Acetobacteraceae bacterium]|nr:acetolactate decarboxylase [Acetobacteraceae bacterium]
MTGISRFETPGRAVRRWIQEAMAREHPDEIFQTSTMGALLAGVYEGDITIRELLRHGDFGLGTFNALDGEMLLLEGVCYQLRSDGSATIADPDELSPFAMSTWFRPDHTIAVSEPTDAATLQSMVDESVGSTNLILAVRVTGEFSEVHTRTVTAQHKPYKPFTEATKDQHEVRFADVCGRLAGFRAPEYEQGIAVAGYHMHFIDKPRRHGGHALDYRLSRGSVDVCVRSELHLSLQRTRGFLSADLNPADVDTQIRQTEGG